MGQLISLSIIYSMLLSKSEYFSKTVLPSFPYNGDIPEVILSRPENENK